MYKISFYKIYFASRNSFLDIFIPKVFYQFQGKFKYEFLYQKIPYTTRIINLEDKTIDDIKKDFKSNTRNEINRSIKDNNEWHILENKNEFLHFYNKFADSMKLKKIHQKDLKHLFITKIVSQDNDVLAMHSYIIDKQIKRARLLHSATLLNNEKYNRAFIGRANRLLHFKDIEYFLNLKYKIYDLGGVSGSNDPKLRGIDNFKKSFGGHIMNEFHYVHPLIKMIKNFKNR